MSSKQWFNVLVGVGFAVFLVIGLVRFGMSLGTGTDGSGTSDGSFAPDAVAAEVKGGKQVIQLGYSATEGNYAPSTIRLKKDVPVDLVVDLSTVRGCLTSIISPALGVQGTARPGSNIISFTPRKAGRFAFSCPMGMGTGEFVVEG